MSELKRIMCVDDQETILKITSISLQRIGGFEVRTCNSGKIALEMVEEFAPQLILLDVMMPEMDGPETFKKLHEKKISENIPVIFLTAKVRPQEIKEYTDLGAVDVISKPFDPVELPKQLQQIWAKISTI